MNEFLGHTKNDKGAGVPELLKDHLNAVAQRASAFMAVWGQAFAGCIMGLFHDLGKYADQMQYRLANPSTVKGKNHAAAGACCIAYRYQNSQPLALAVLYHHGGLKKLNYRRKEMLASILKAFNVNPDMFTETNLTLLTNRFHVDFPDVPVKPIPNLLSGKMKIAADMLDIRMVASALDDADFIETEAHFGGDQDVPRRYRQQGAELDADLALSVVRAHLKTKTTANDVVRDIRQTLSSACRDAGNLPLGIYLLTAPTGSGKTLSMLLFALLHAKKHGLRRIVLVMPFLNIIDQTAKLYREIFSAKNGFPENYVLEDHSLAGFSDDTGGSDFEADRRRIRILLAENWDAPIVLTTSVKFFESLHTCRNSKLRKLHRLAKSVILFDEAQSLPPNLAALSLATLSRLAEPDSPYGSTIVFATATQPAFDTLSPLIKQVANYSWKPGPLIPNETVQSLFNAMSDRVQVQWRDANAIGLEALAIEMMDYPSMQVLCILNLKRHAGELAEILAGQLGPEVVYHLSTLMCSKHRKAVLEIVQERVKLKKPVILVATQCIEAGVDISFPVVYRALAPFDAIAQAAGRCNRHGGETGIVIVFKPHDEKSFYPPGYGEGISATTSLLCACRNEGVNPDKINILNNPDFIRRYYQLYFEIGNYKEVRSTQESLFEAVRAGDFEQVDEQYKLIPGDRVNVLVPYDLAAFDRLREIVQKREFMQVEAIREWVARARGHSVGLYRPTPDSMGWQALEPVQFGVSLKYDYHDADWFVCLPAAEYDSLCGLKLPESFITLC